jgi:hypothetical protein
MLEHFHHHRPTVEAHKQETVRIVMKEGVGQAMLDRLQERAITYCEKFGGQITITPERSSRKPGMFDCKIEFHAPDGANMHEFDDYIVGFNRYWQTVL